MQSWQDILLEYISIGSEEKAQVAKRVGDVASTTVQRWARREMKPKNANTIRLLSRAIPGREQEMMDALKREFGARFPEAFKELEEREIPSIYYRLNVEVLAYVDEARIQEVLFKNIWHQLYPVLDPNQDGLVVFLATCIAPIGASDKVERFYVQYTDGTGPWIYKQKQAPFLWGGNIAVARAIKQLQPICYPVDSRLIISLGDLTQFGLLRSLVAFPVVRRKKVAGVFCIASVHGEEFFSEQWCNYIQLYVEQLALAFDKDEYYDPDQIQPKATPSLHIQESMFDLYAELASQVRLMYPDISNEDCEKRVLHRIRDALRNT